MSNKDLEAAVPLYSLSFALNVPTPPVRAPPFPFLPPLRCKWMALGDTLLTPCNNTVTHQFNNKFKYRAQETTIFLTTTPWRSTGHT